MTASTATPSAQDLGNGEKAEKERHLRSQARTTLRYWWRGKSLKTVELLGGLIPKLSWGSSY